MPFLPGGPTVPACVPRVLATVALCLVAHAARAEGAPQSHAPVQGADCKSCHTGQPTVASGDFLSLGRVPAPEDFVDEGIAMCSDCHGAASSHVVGVPTDYVVPPDLPLGKGGVMTCVTCHYSHGSLDSERPRASFSFTDRLTDSPRLRKSFLLRRDNSRGELCQVCHNPANEGHEP